RRPRQQLSIDCLDLVWKRLQIRGGDCEHRIEQRRIANPQRLRRKPPQFRVSVKGPNLTGSPQTEANFAVAAKHGLIRSTVSVPVGESEEVGPMPTNGDDIDRVSSNDAVNAHSRHQVFEAGTKLGLDWGRILVTHGHPQLPAPSPFW